MGKWSLEDNKKSKNSMSADLQFQLFPIECNGFASFSHHGKRELVKVYIQEANNISISTRLHFRLFFSVNQINVFNCVWRLINFIYINRLPFINTKMMLWLKHSLFFILLLLFLMMSFTTFIICTNIILKVFDFGCAASAKMPTRMKLLSLESIPYSTTFWRKLVFHDTDAVNQVAARLITTLIIKRLVTFCTLVCIFIINGCFQKY